MVGRWIVTLSVAALLAKNEMDQEAAKAKPKPPAKSKKGKEADKEKEQERDREQDKSDEQPTTAEDAKAATKEDSVKTAGTATPKSQSAAEVKVKEDKEGVKTYKFETVEVE